MIKRKQYYLILLLVLSMNWLLAACMQEKQDEKTTYRIYYVNKDETGVLFYDYETEAGREQDILEELITQLKTVPEKLAYHPPITGNVVLTGYELSEGQLYLDFDENYKKQEIITEILVRAAIVRTMMQVHGVDNVSFLVNEEPLTDASGTVVGVMNQETFIDNAGNEINTYERVKLQLYFANEEGNALTTVNRNVLYSSNIPLERQIVEEIIAGPKENDISTAQSNAAYPVINPETKVVSVAIKDGICYVNLDDGFLDKIYHVSSEIPVYAITNSLAELSNVNKVQISVNGETNVNYSDTIQLSNVFERNLDVVGTREP